MKHALIVGHPNEKSFTLSVARVYAEAVGELGHTVVLRDLYRLGFDPTLRDEEIPRPSGFAAGADIEAERALIGDADVFVFVYPLWFYAPPAILLGYMQRVFGMGFGYGPIRGGGNAPLLRPKSMLSFSSSGAPAEWVRSEGAWASIRAVFDQHFADVCGLTVLDHRHFGRVLNSIPASRIDAHFREVRRTVMQNFGPRQGGG